MPIKDYYTILELSPSATPDEIKKAYRRLALLYHPDKNNNDKYASAQFEEIKEAYEILTHPARKERYLQQRWYAKSTGQRRTQGIITPVTVLKQMLDLDKHTRTLDQHRMDQEGLFEYLQDLLSDSTIEKLNSFNEPTINKEIILSALNSLQLLGYSFLPRLIEQLKKISVSDQHVVEKLDQFLGRSRRVAYWEKRTPVIIFLFVVFICLFIFFAARK